MLPVTHGEKSTKVQMIIYTLILLPLSISPYFLGVSGIGYAIGAFALSAFFIFTAIRVFFDKDEEKNFKSAKLMFGYSVFYLFALFTILMIDKV